MEMMNIYISGPITGKTKSYCIWAFGYAKTQIEHLGHFGVSPWALADVLPKSFKHEDYMAVDLEIMKRCDAVLFMDGWRQSEGCNKERAVAELAGIKIYDRISDIPRVRPPLTDEQVENLLDSGMFNIRLIEEAEP